MLVRYKTFPPFFNEIDQLFTTAYPLFDRAQFVEQKNGVTVIDNGDSVKVTVDIPGIAKESVSVTLHDDKLFIVADRKTPEITEKDQWVRNEIRYGKFERSIDLPYPVAAENISATQENGVLHIVLPKAEEAKPKQISIR